MTRTRTPAASGSHSDCCPELAPARDRKPVVASPAQGCSHCCAARASPPALIFLPPAPEPAPGCGLELETTSAPAWPLLAGTRRPANPAPPALRPACARAHRCASLDPCAPAAPYQEPPVPPRLPPGRKLRSRLVCVLVFYSLLRHKSSCAQNFFLPPIIHHGTNEPDSLKECGWNI